MSFYDWSTTASNNGAVDATINWAEFQDPSTVNDSARAMMARVAEWRKDVAPTRSSTGSGNAYAVASEAGGSTAYRDGEIVTFIADRANTSACTLNVNARGAKAFRPAIGVDFKAGEIQANQAIIAFYRSATEEFIGIGSGYHVNAMTTGLLSQSIAARLIKIGTPVLSLAPTAPAGYIRLTEATQTRNKSDWPELDAWLSSISYPWGSTSTTFNLPPAAGYVLRFAATSSSIDTAGARTAGSTQTDAVAAHTHTFSATTSTDGAHTHTVANVTTNDTTTAGSGGTFAQRSVATATTSSSGTHSHTISGTTGSTGGTETRPRNVAMHVDIFASSQLSAGTLAMFGFPYAWDTGTTAADPGTARVRGNNATLASITALYINETDAWGVNIGSVIGAVAVGSIIRLSKVGAQANTLVMTVTGTLTDNGTYRTIPVTVSAINGSFSANDSLAFELSGGAGANGVTVPDISGLAELTLVDDESDFGIVYDTSAAGHKSFKPKNLGFTPSGTGAVQRTLQSKLRDAVSVLDFIPTAYHAAILAGTSTDDVTTYIQAALDAHATVALTGTGSRYVVTAKIYLNTNNTLCGPGTLHYTPAVSAPVLWMLNADDVTDWAVIGVRFELSGSNGHAYGVNATASTLGATARGSVLNCTFVRCSGAFFTRNVLDFRFSNNRVLGDSWSLGGVAMGGGNGVTSTDGLTGYGIISDNYFEYCRSEAVDANWNNKFITISRNVCYNCDVSGGGESIDFGGGDTDGSADCEIVDNIIVYDKASSTSGGILVKRNPTAETNRIVVSRNIIYNAQTPTDGAGILVSNATDVVISNNIATNCYYGVTVSGSTLNKGHLISGNTIVDAVNRGISVQSAHEDIHVVNNTVRSNVVAATLIYVTSATTGSRTTVRNNNVIHVAGSNATNPCIYVRDSVFDTVVDGNTTYGGKQGVLVLSTATRPTVTRNTVRQADEIGIDVQTTSQAIIDHNIVENCSTESAGTYYGIRFYASNGSCYGNTVRDTQVTKTLGRGIQVSAAVTSSRFGSHTITDLEATNVPINGWTNLGAGCLVTPNIGAQTFGLTTVNTNADFTLTPRSSSWEQLHTGTLTADRTVTLSTTNARSGDTFSVTRTGSGAFNLSVGGLVNLTTNTYCQVRYNGSAWVLASFGSLTTLPVALGGTGATTAADARTNLGLAIGTNVQAYDATLTSMASLGTAADRIAYTTGIDTWAETPLTSTARNLLDDTSAGAMRTTLGVGTGDSPQFTAIELGHASDTTLARSGAGDMTIEGNAVYRAGGTDVPIADGGTGASTAADAAKNLGVRRILAQSAVASSHTGDTNQTALATVTIPANAIGPNGHIVVIAEWSITNSANNKLLKVFWNGTGGTHMSAVTLTASATYRTISRVLNRNSASSQVIERSGTSANPFAGSTVSWQTTSVDTTAAVDIVFTAQLVNTGETITLESYTVELYSGA